MKDNLVRKLLKTFWFREGSKHRILFGPMKGLCFRTNQLIGISPVYSGPERDHQNLFAQLVKPGDCVIDVGANWGNHTLYFARLTGENGMVHAFEPIPEVMAELRWHLNANHFANVKTHEIALSNETGEANFIVGPLSETSHLENIRPEQNDQKENAIRVVVQTLDSLADDLSLETVKLIKIDVEGAESKTLEGAEQTIRRLKPHLVIDLHTPEQDLKVAAMLDEWGYQLSRVGGGDITRLDRSWPDPDGVWGSIHARPGTDA